MLRGDVIIAYPGNLQGRHIRELGARGALLVSAEDGEITDVDRLEVDVMRWCAVEVDISAIAERKAAIRAAGLALDRALEDTPSHLPLAVRVVFKGRSAAHAALVADEGQLRQEIIAQAVALNPDRVWIEKVKLASEAPDTGHLQTESEVQGALGELAVLALAARDDPDFVQSVQADWLALLEKLPHEVFQASPDLQALKQDPLAQVAERLQQATAVLMGRVAQNTDSSV
jgi:hypothetical protein